MGRQFPLFLKYTHDLQKTLIISLSLSLFVCLTKTLIQIIMLNRKIQHFFQWQSIYAALENQKSSTAFKILSKSPGASKRFLIYQLNRFYITSGKLKHMIYKTAFLFLFNF